MDARLAELRRRGSDALAEVQGVLPPGSVASWGLTPAGKAALKARIDELDVDSRVGLLLVAVEAMPELRPDGGTELGALMYGAAADLYRRRLPLDEVVLAELLQSARHDCGHGVDTRAPFDLAVRFQERHGYSRRLGAAIAAYVAAFPKSNAVQLQAIRRHASLLAVLEPAPAASARRTSVPWIDAVRTALATTTGTERAGWERFVLSIRVSEQMTMPSSWVRRVTPALDALGADTVHRRLEQWWPRGPIESLAGSGAQLLKHLVWTLALTEHAEGEALVASLATIEWRPRAAPMAVLKPAATFLAEARTDAGREGRDALLQQIAAEEQPTAVAASPLASPLVARLLGRA